MKPVTIHAGSTGLNTVDNPRRISKSGDLGAAVNIRIDQSGQISRRDGQELVQSGEYHSIYSNGQHCFVIKDGAIYEVGTDGSLRSVESGLFNNRFSWCYAVNRFYYTNGIDIGYIESGKHNEWVKTADLGPDNDKEFVGPFAGSHLAFHGGRIFIAKENAIWWSEVHSHGLFHLFGSFVQFGSNIRMIKPVASGMFASTQRRTFFLNGINPQQFVPIQVCAFPALEWSECTELIEGAEIGIGNPGLCALWNSTEGAIVGTPSGSVINMTKSKIIYPENVTQGFSVLSGYNFLHRSF